MSIKSAKYGANETFIDVTETVLNELKKSNSLKVCNELFTDPLIGVVKELVITYKDESIEKIKENNMYIYNKSIINKEQQSINILDNLHKNIKLKYGSLKDEFPEQQMAVMYIKPNNKVLEIGGNIGRNSLIITNLLEKQSNLVVLECDENIAKQLKENKELNNANFQIENSALSKRKLIQKGWDTIPSDVLKAGYKWVPTINYEELKNKYQIEWDTLVLDCEGAFYYILMDMPEILNGINTIIMENDYHDINHKKYVDMILSNNGFKNVYKRSGGWGVCYNCFFEVWCIEENQLLYPITFSIPEEKVIKNLPNKTKMVATIIPGNQKTYIYDNEKDYYNGYQNSFFGITTKKAGWDCLRHYEILANGCIPYFPDIELCPVNTMSLLPKNMFIECNNLYKIYSNKNIKELNNTDTEILNKMVDKLLSYTLNNLTTVKIAKYILDKSKKNNTSKILYLSGNTEPDYLRCLTLHGLKMIYGINCHDFPKISHIYKNNKIDAKKLYGKGITYTNLLDQELNNNIEEPTVIENINNKYYDLIIYGSYHRGVPYYDLISNIYKPDKIILLCGEDIHRCDYKKWVNKGHYVFVREF